MLAAKTLKRYIERCDEILNNNSSNDTADPLVTEIVSVLQNDIKGITYNLVSYGPYVEGADIDYIADLCLLRARLQKELDAVEPDSVPEEQPKKRKKKIFISHATKDKEYIAFIVNLLEALGFHEDEIICSSIPPYCIPLDNNVFDWLVNEFENSDLHMIFALSKTYYKRPACLNEMGAAWAMKHNWTAILLPGFDFDEIEGCIDPRQVSIKLDDKDTNTLKFHLGELKDNLIAEFGLRTISSALWEKKRDEFLDKIDKESKKHVSESGEEIINPITKTKLGKDELLLLIYAADDSRGQILVEKSIVRSEPSIFAHEWDFNIDDTARGAARWSSTLDCLERIGFVKADNKEQGVYKVTEQGYKTAEQEKVKMNIDTNRDPYEYLDD